MHKWKLVGIPKASVNLHEVALQRSSFKLFFLLNIVLCAACAVCSPSDLDADFEDNQDYDSTVSQSETKLPMFIPSSRVDSVQEVESPTSNDSVSAARPCVSDPSELQRVAVLLLLMLLFSMPWKLGALTNVLRWLMR